MVCSGFCLTAAAVVILTGMGSHDNAPLLLTGFVLLGFGLEVTLFGAYESMLSEARRSRPVGPRRSGRRRTSSGPGSGSRFSGA